MCMHTYVCKSGHVHVRALVWKSEDTLRCQSLLSTLFKKGCFFKNSFSTAQARIARLWSSRKLCFSSKGIQIVLYIQFLTCSWEFNLKSSHSHNVCFFSPLNPVTRLSPNSLVSKTLEWSERTDVTQGSPSFLRVNKNMEVPFHTVWRFYFTGSVDKRLSVGQIPVHLSCSGICNRCCIP